MLQGQHDGLENQRKHEENMAELERLRWVSGLSQQQLILAQAWQAKQEAMQAFYRETLSRLQANLASALGLSKRLLCLTQFASGCKMLHLCLLAKCFPLAHRMLSLRAA